MAYNTEDLFNIALKAIEKNQPLFIEELVSFMPCDKTTFYRHFPKESNEYNELKEKIDFVKINQKASLRKNWKNPDSAPALQLALYKLLASPDEHKALQMNYQDVTSEGKQVNVISLGTGKNPDEPT